MYNANIDSLVNYNVHILAKKRTINRSVSRILPLPEESGKKKKRKKEKRSDVNEYTKEKTMNG